jgi:hypothetical protein
MDQQIDFKLLDDDTGKGPALKGMVQIGTGTIMLHFEGFGDGGSPKGEGFPVCLLWQNGELKLYVWDNINNEEASHIINLAGAREK